MTTKTAKRKLLLPYESVRDEGLKNWQVARAYLQLALQDGLDAFLDALRNVAQAHGMTTIARKSGLTRPALYKLLSPKGNPHARSLWQVMEALDVQFDLALKKAA
ncbi:MAG: addiction module antidote protein [bacterium]